MLVLDTKSNALLATFAQHIVYYMETLQFKTTINCGGCVKAVTPTLNRLEEVTDWNVDTEHPDKLLNVQSTTGDRQRILEAVQKAGFEITPIH